MPVIVMYSYNCTLYAVLCVCVCVNLILSILSWIHCGILDHTPYRYSGCTILIMVLTTTTCCSLLLLVILIHCLESLQLLNCVDFIMLIMKMGTSTSVSLKYTISSNTSKTYDLALSSCFSHERMHIKSVVFYWSVLYPCLK